MNADELGWHALVRRRTLLVAVAVAAFCLTAGSACADAGAQQKYPDVLAAKVQARASDRFDFDVTISSPYDTPQRYADAFRVLGQGGRVYGERTLFHDHAGEQPFTRDLYGVQIPSGIRTVIVEGRDKTFGYGGKSVEVILPGR
ncbi:hypothetical protein [Candidatus Accumulibacter sp. ACC003]|uniref:hypothetical protein n=1 Tax=Candidatus Accumulibacter sp. ACC003 TaxID=2823334 RepID=UPI0025C0A587|nr:hypothetical protein [Candidatus Accumulibacter sp. ACC003]